MSFNLHIVGEDTIDNSDEIAADIVAALEAHDHQLVSAVITDDSGQTVLSNVPVTPPAEPGTDTPPDEIEDPGKPGKPKPEPK